MLVVVPSTTTILTLSILIRDGCDNVRILVVVVVVVVLILLFGGAYIILGNFL